MIEKLGFESFEHYGFPNIINVCVIRGACPCQCIHCPVGITPPAERPIKFGHSTMSVGLFENIVTEMSEYPHSTLRLHGVGEPLLWNELAHALKFAFEHNVLTWIFTSLITKDQSLLKALVSYCNIIEISINAFDKQEYQKTKGINAFDQVRTNLEFLRGMINKDHLSTRIIVSRVESKNKRYDADFIDYWKSNSLVDDAFVRSYHDYNSVLANKLGQKTQGIIPCLVHWSRFNIDNDGTVVLCFNELFKGPIPNADIVLGNIEKQTIGEIWHCEKLNLLRRAQLNRDYSGIDFKETLPCLNCTSCQPYRGGNKPTSEFQIKFINQKNNGK